MIAAYEPTAGIKVQSAFGASGTLKDAIAKGERAEVFASANMEHPQALAAAKPSGPVVLFVRNQLCALAKPGLAINPATLLERMLDPTIKLATSTPKADPSGDYAWEVFRKTEKLKPGSFATLEKRASSSSARPAACGNGGRVARRLSVCDVHPVAAGTEDPRQGRLHRAGAGAINPAQGAYSPRAQACKMP